MAAVHSIAEDAAGRAEAMLWSRFAAPSDAADLRASWLSLLALRLGRTRAALLLWADDAPGSFAVAAAWPDPQRDLQYLGPTAQRALLERRGVVGSSAGELPSPDGSAQIAYPVESGGELLGAVVLDLGAGPRDDLQQCLRQVHWASGWLLEGVHAQRLREREQALDRVHRYNRLMATALQERSLSAAAQAVAAEIAIRLACDRVSVGFVDGRRVVPVVLSNTASFDARSDLVRTLGDAMDEALDLGVALQFPVPEGDEMGVMVHRDAARRLGIAAMLSVPLMHDARTVGVLTLERADGPAFTAAERAELEDVAPLLGAAWGPRRQQERPWWSKAREAVAAAAHAIAGPRRPGLKLVMLALMLCAAALALVDAPHRVTARTVVEGATQLATAAPFDGYLAEGFVRAGDMVRAGQPMAQLDRRDLELERARWAAELEQLRRRHQVAMAQGDRAATGVLAAQMLQTRAQLDLAAEKLARSTLLAPHDGIVVSGDLSQSIGTPVEQGKVLFEVAPLDGFRVVLQVDERDIAYMAAGQRGELVLSSRPGRPLPFVVSRITPVATQQDGQNVFRAEARMDELATGLRPGLEGVGKVAVGERPLLWLWTHRFTGWLRLALWTWMP